MPPKSKLGTKITLTVDCQGRVLNGEPVQTTADEVMAAEEQAWSARLNTAEGFPPPRTWIWIFLVETVFVFQPRAPGN